MNNKFFKAAGFILNIVLVILFFVFTVISKISYSLMESLPQASVNWFVYASVYTEMAIPLVIVLALAMSLSYRKEEEYKKSVFIQFLPAAVYFLTLIFSFLSQI